MKESAKRATTLPGAARQVLIRPLNLGRWKQGQLLCRIRYMNQERYKTFGKSFKDIRENKGLSQDAVAKAAGIGRSTLVHLENGADVRLSKISAVAKVLGANIEAVTESKELAERRQVRLQQTVRVQSLQNAHLRIALNLSFEDPSTVSALEDAKTMVALWEREQSCSAFYIDTWKLLLSGPPRDVGTALSQIDKKWEPALLQNSPFGSLINRQT